MVIRFAGWPGLRGTHRRRRSEYISPPDGVQQRNVTRAHVNCHILISAHARVGQTGVASLPAGRHGGSVSAGPDATSMVTGAALGVGDDLEEAPGIAKMDVKRHQPTRDCSQRARFSVGAIRPAQGPAACQRQLTVVVVVFVLVRKRPVQLDRVQPNHLELFAADGTGDPLSHSDLASHRDGGTARRAFGSGRFRSVIRNRHANLPQMVRQPDDGLQGKSTESVCKKRAILQSNVVSKSKILCQFCNRIRIGP
jgi:hypothetical protein